LLTAAQPRHRANHVEPCCNERVSDPSAPAAHPAGHTDEMACLEAMRRGEPGCLGAVFETWADRLYGLALRLLGDPAAAEDVVQEAFLKLMAGASRVEGRSRLATWLYRVVYNASMDRLRDQKREVPAAFEEEENGAPAPTLRVDLRLSPEKMLKDTELRAALDRAIASLPTPHRAVFLLRDVEGLSTLEAAEALGISEVNLKVRLHRARLQLRERLSEFAAARGARAEGNP
jgi:RNA polymerase sigma-70 factor (ECF subfamily)